MSQRIREDCTFFQVGSLDYLEYRCRHLAVNIDVDSSAIKSDEYADVFEDLVPEIIRYIRLLEKNIDRYEGTPICKGLRETANFCNDMQLDEILQECRRTAVDINNDGSAVKADCFEDNFRTEIPDLITHARLLETRMDRYQDRIEQAGPRTDIWIRLGKMEELYEECKSRLDSIEAVRAIVFSEDPC